MKRRILKEKMERLEDFVTDGGFQLVYGPEGSKSQTYIEFPYEGKTYYINAYDAVSMLRERAYFNLGLERGNLTDEELDAFEDYCNEHMIDVLMERGPKNRFYMEPEFVDSDVLDRKDFTVRESRNSNVIRLNEHQLKMIIKESVKKVLKQML